MERNAVENIGMSSTSFLDQGFQLVLHIFHKSREAGIKQTQAQ